MNNALNLFKKNRLYVFALFLVCSSSALPQTRSYRFQHLNAHNGLSHSSITSVIQDRNGFLWIGSWDGLNRYDGYQSKIFRHISGETSISDSSVTCLVRGEGDHLWVGTSSGLNRFHTVSGDLEVFKRVENDPASLSDNTIQVLEIGPSGDLWVGTAKGLNQFNPASGGFRHYRYAAHNPQALIDENIRSLAFDRSGTLWVGTQRGLSRLNPNSGDIINYPTRSWVNAILHDSRGTCWLGTGDGLLLFDTEKDELVAAPMNGIEPNFRISSLFEDHAGRFWIGTQFDGLIRYERATGHTRQFRHDPTDADTLSNNHIQSIYEDHTGILWLGTRSWLNKLHLSRQRFRHYKQQASDSHSLSSNSVRALYRDRGGRLWVGTTAGLNRFDPARNQYVTVPLKDEEQHPQGQRTYAIAEGRGNAIWLGTGHGLVRLQGDHQQRFKRGGPQSLSHNSIRTLLIDHLERLWIGTKGGGLNLLDETNFEFRHFTARDTPGSISNNFIYALYSDSRNRLWLGTLGGGINRYNEQGGFFESWQNNKEDPRSLSNDMVFAINEDAQQNLWVGTSSGLNRMRPGQEGFDIYQDVRNPSNTFYGILLDDQGQLWLSSSCGLARFSPSTGQFKFFSQQDGLQGDTFNLGAAFKSNDGQLYFGGVNGYNAFFPGYIKDDVTLPIPVLTEFTTNNRQRLVSNDPQTFRAGLLQLGNEVLSVDHETETISFSFAALHYAVPEENRYAYKLSPFDNEWLSTPADRRFISYTNLPAGDYTFKLKVANRDGVWNPKELTFPLIVAPPPWLSWWAFAIYALLLLFILKLIAQVQSHLAHNRQQALEQQNQRLEKAVEERTHQLRRAHKELLEVAHQSGMAEIATSVLHNVGNVLNSISVSGQCLEDLLKDTHMPGRLNRANELFETMLARGIQKNDRKAFELLKYYRLVEARLRKDVSQMEEDVTRVQEGIKIIKNIVKSQQSYASAGSQEEEVILDRIVRDALGILDASFLRHQVIVDFKGDPHLSLSIQRTKLIHVILNILKNAKEAMEYSPIKKLHIVVDKDNDYGYLRVTDTGEGIDPSNINAIFTHGFTTKKGGHGFGLHSCANAMTEMGGELWVESEGKDQGATFHLKVPLNKSQRRH